MEFTSMENAFLFLEMAWCDGNVLSIKQHRVGFSVTFNCILFVIMRPLLTFIFYITLVLGSSVL